MERLVADHKNLVVLKSMSKVYALSGARVGYLAAHSNVIEQVGKYIPPWSVGLLGQVAGVEALKNEEYYTKRIAETHILREDLSEKLKKIPGVVVYPGCANFVLLSIGDTGKKAQNVYGRLARQNIYVRDASSMSSQFHQDFIRISVRDRKSNDQIYSALKGALTNE
ncbi:MAG: aminotransferase class I/II-fold pyridoxal phosphate-dependent enzyme [Thaumarchaeota archaeon]|nr:aminotransferase class I/II-fold pyridoxal phosphate-dependent enzyme [Nitrososphaerota archaeon]